MVVALIQTKEYERERERGGYHRTYVCSYCLYGCIFCLILFFIHVAVSLYFLKKLLNFLYFYFNYGIITSNQFKE